MNASERPVTLLVCALGGEGGGVLAEWLVDVASACGHAVQSTSIPGVAQRTGATTYYVEVAPRPGGPRPIFGLTPVPGALDLLVSSELLETVRQIGNGLATPEHTHVISSRSRTLTTAEKMQPGDGRASSEPLQAVVQRYSREAQVFDMGAVAAEAGTIVSAVLLGAIAASGVLPFARAAFEQVLAESGRGAAASQRGFAQAFEIVGGLRAERAAVQSALQALPEALRVSAASVATSPVAWQDFPPALHEMIGLGHARMLEYQDAAYARLYLERLRRVLEAERSADPDGTNGFETTRTTARYLALWMAFDDIIRVAALKSRATRHARVRREVKAANGDVLRIFDHFKPGIPELAALLPQRFAAPLVRWDRRRVASGRPALALPLKLASHSITGLVALRLLAALKGLRRHGSRYGDEQALIERWLGGVERAARSDWALGHELAECGRLIKGYGATHERGKTRLLHVLDHLAAGASFETAAQRAAAFRSVRSAALSDGAGRALDEALQQHGAPPTPVREQPVFWVRKRSAAKAAS